MVINLGITLLFLVLGAVAVPAPHPTDRQSLFQNEALSGRIVGGTEAAEGSHPHMAAITIGRLVRAYVCGGSIIGRRTVLTAAHCLDSFYSSGSLSSSLGVTVGANDWWRGNGTAYRVSSNLTYPGYENNDYTHDIAILYTSTAITYSPLVQSIALNFEFIGGGVSARVAGWGSVFLDDDYIQASLRELTVSTVEGDRCVTEVAQKIIDNGMEWWDLPPVLPDLELCAIHANGAGHGACHGDSGSALVDLGTGRQIGVVNWGLPCALGAPDMYARVSAYEEWLTENLRN